MSIEFVDPDPIPPGAPADPADAADPDRPSDPDRPVERRSARTGRVLAAVVAVAALLTGGAMLAPLYVVHRTAFVVDFDGTTTQTARIPFDAFGGSDAAPLDTRPAPAPGGGFFAYGSTLTVSLGDGIRYAPWWLGAAGALVVAAGWSLARVRARGPGVLAAVLGGALLSSLGTAWLQIRAVADRSLPQIRYTADPAAGFWLLLAGGAVAVLAGVLVATRPTAAALRRLVPSPRQRDRRRLAG